MKIVVLDGFTLNPGDLDWSPLQNLGTTKIFDRSTTAQILERSEGADIVLSNKAILDKSTLQKLKHLKLIAVTATGYNNIDVHAAHELGISVCNARNYSSASVAQQTLALILELTNQCGLHSTSVKNGEWSRCEDWSYRLSAMTELAGKTIGIVGFGHIGQMVAQIARGFGMQVLANRKNPKKDESNDVEYVSLDHLLQNSDIVSLHCPLTEENKGFINTQSLALMKPTSLLINTSRGPLIHEKDLEQALRGKSIGGAGLDVLCQEPPYTDHPLFTLENCLITPHHAWATLESRQRLLDIVVDNVAAFIKGEAKNLVH
ncbi:D-2-hydroxyacid dehydrogenase [Fulvivirgaceae bacterium BMA12]|uniref:D-2-hydroxyacid dehydrogenase n=1 Tax=Agaribacillus aureus TaxID=3051825 RepID=A0ABT8L9Z0_9BACT|nr:D-2-hydroxyacid dehydrogenase [Fulvivirgaceae bacterium BMA12]